MILKSKTKVILDTNILLLPGQKGIDIFTQIPQDIDEAITLCTYSCVIDELDQLMSKKSQTGFNAKLGYIMSKQKDLKIIKGSNNLHADDVIVQNANAKNQIVVTQDAKLQNRLLEAGVRVMQYQQKKFVFITRRGV